MIADNRIIIIIICFGLCLSVKIGRSKIRILYFTRRRYGGVPTIYFLLLLFCIINLSTIIIRKKVLRDDDDVQSEEDEEKGKELGILSSRTCLLYYRPTPDTFSFLVG
jgi:hypothetical protein